MRTPDRQGILSLHSGPWHGGLRFVRAYSGYDGLAYRAASTGRLILVAER